MRLPTKNDNHDNISDIHLTQTAVQKGHSNRSQQEKALQAMKLFKWMNQLLSSRLFSMIIFLILIKCDNRMKPMALSSIQLYHSPAVEKTEIPVYRAQSGNGYYNSSSRHDSHRYAQLLDATSKVELHYEAKKIAVGTLIYSCGELES